MPTNVLSEAAVTALLSRPMAVRVFEEIDSTNAEAKRVTTAGNRADTLFWRIGRPPVAVDWGGRFGRRSKDFI